MKLISPKLQFALALLALASAPVLGAAPNDTEQQAWDDFVAWVKVQPGVPNRSEWQRYQEKLVADGFTAEAAGARMGLLGKLRATHGSDLGRVYFNRLYAARDHSRFIATPNTFLVDVAKTLQPGKALDVAMGQGRNAVYLAALGWDVTGVDLADEGLRIAQENAAAAGTKLTTVNKSFEEFDYGEAQWDLICFIYTDAPVIDPVYVARIIKALKPGGLLLIERPHRRLDVEDPELGALLPKDFPNALPRAWDGLRILRYEDLLGVSDWQQTSANREQLKLRIIRLLAEKR
ncbi:class I SAM-dependent methyltransferase [Opitutus terrae]|uniref:Methyltransferase type 11 n=1 Tax=Opitutus terrae (strain DSM 11246 / JCM 15787 / PB90-1) TaxID=452637 RepID=B1ZZB7_OPITP|nr:class I SAM-dependent methyltransferase [Opitutus terrae]ACB77189.1 Methyltransferase type 11 [Opitutus terrae PB90-1]